MSGSGTPAPTAPIDEAAARVGPSDKWLARWPEWTIAEVFLPRPHAPLAAAWAALQQELTDAAWSVSDPRPGDAKLGWWQEELHGWTTGMRRHPLGAALQPQSAPWVALAAALPVLMDRERPRDLDEARSQLLPLARAAAAIDTALFAEGAAAPDAAPADADQAAVVASLLQARCVRAGAAQVPLSVLAEAGERDPLPLWRRQLRQQWPAAAASTRPRRLWAALAFARLAQDDPSRPLSPWRTLPLAWRSARAGRN